LIKGLSYPGSTVLDFFAGSGTTGRVCIEEKRNCIMVDNDKETVKYFEKHLDNMKLNKYLEEYILKINPDLDDFLDNIKSS